MLIAERKGTRNATVRSNRRTTRTRHPATSSMRQSGTSIPARRASASATASHRTISRSSRAWGNFAIASIPPRSRIAALGRAPPSDVPGPTSIRRSSSSSSRRVTRSDAASSRFSSMSGGTRPGARFGQEWATGAGPEPERANPQLVIHKEEEVGFEEGTGRASLQPVQAGSGRGARSMRGRTRRTRSRDRRGLEPKDARPEPACLPCQRIPGSHARGRDRSRAAARPHVPRRRIARAGLGGDRVSRPGHPADRGNPAAHRRPVPAESHAKAVFNGEEATEGAEPVDPCTWLEIELSSESFP